MFGYVCPRFEQLNEDQKRRYRQIYCGICQELQGISGYQGRLVLSHDMTFLAMLINSLEDPGEQVSQNHCPIHPLKKQMSSHNQLIRYASAMNLLLMYYKCEDKIIDHESLSGKAEKRMLEAPLESIRVQYPRQCDQVDKALREIWIEEKRKTPDPDKLTNLSAAMLGAVFVPDDHSFWAGALRSIGEGLGRFIYWMDAWDDLESDRKHHRYNPLAGYTVFSEMNSFAQAVLEMCMGEVTAYFESLPLEKDLDLMRNVLYSGVWQRYYALQSRGGKEKSR